MSPLRRKYRLVFAGFPAREAGFFYAINTIIMVSTLEQPSHRGASRAVLTDHTRDRVLALATPIAVTHGLSVLDVEWTRAGGISVLRVTIDRPESPMHEIDLAGAPQAPEVAGVGVDDCARVSRDLSVALDAEDFIAGRYRLEVSSPGIDRPLRGEADFRRHLGRLVKLKLAEPAADGQRVLRGTLIEVAPGEVVVEVDGNRHAVATDSVVRAQLVPALGAARGGKAAGAGVRRKRRAAAKRPAGRRKRARRGAVDDS